VLDAKLTEAAVSAVGRFRTLRWADDTRAFGRVYETSFAARYIGDPRRFEPELLRGLTPDEVRQLIPHSWARRPASRGSGEVFEDPQHFGRQIRLMRGYPQGTRAGLLHEGPYAVVSQGGVKIKIPLGGNPVLK
jgi:hypothetical protein